VIGFVPVQPPLSTVSGAFLHQPLPEMAGAEVFFGACPVAATMLVAREVAMPEPVLLVAVTVNAQTGGRRRRWSRCTACSWRR